MNTTAVKLPPYNLLSALQKAQTTLEHYNVGGTLVIDSDQLEAAEVAVTKACEALTGVQALLMMAADWNEATCLEIAKLITNLGVVVRSSTDEGLTAQQLAEKYAGETVQASEHPAFSASDWQAAVWDSHTRLGYWDWVVEQIAGHTPQDLRLES